MTPDEYWDFARRVSGWIDGDLYVLACSYQETIFWNEAHKFGITDRDDEAYLIIQLALEKAGL